MKLVQLLLPLSDNQGRRYDAALFQHLQKTLTDRFGGVTAYTRAPAEGWWATGETHAKDDIVIVEVMVETLDEAWWHALKLQLERDLKQDEIIIRAQPMALL